MKTPTTTVAIVEDNAGICRELQLVISRAPDIVCVCACRNAASALRTIPPLSPEVIIMDLQLPDLSGIDCIRLLKQKVPRAQVLVFTVCDDDERIREALKAGAVGYLLKHSDTVDILTAIRQVKSGGAPLASEVARKLVEQFHRPNPATPSREKLTGRENEVFDLLARGLPDKQIADLLNISAQTVNTHLKNIYSKLQVKTRTEAVAKYHG